MTCQGVQERLSEWLESATTRTPGHALRTWRVASMPFMTGIATSMTTT